MTRKDFALIAAVIRTRRMRSDSRAVHSEMDRLAREFAIELRSTNNSFKEDKFLQACGVICP